jgi:prefoldin subunit 5
MLKKKTFEQRLQVVSKKADQALDVFAKAQKALEKETGDLHAVIAELDTEIERLRKLKDEAVAQLNKNEGFIDRFLDFLGLRD